jgi:hypothetical protein
MMHMPSFIKIGSGVQKLIGGKHIQDGAVINLLLFFLHKESRPKCEVPGTNGCYFNVLGSQTLAYGDHYHILRKSTAVIPRVLRLSLKHPKFYCA